MKKKGFTLIELLAIIVILAIIAVITVPLILNIVEDAKLKSVTDSVYGYKDGILNYDAYLRMLNSTGNGVQGSYTIAELRTAGLKVTGKEPTAGVVLIDNEGVSGCIQYDEYASYLYNNKVINTLKAICPTQKLVTTGAGLYKSNTNPGRMIFRGENPNNKIFLKEDGTNNTLYRIVSYEPDGTIKVVRDEKLSTNRAWDAKEVRNSTDNTYCLSAETYGCNVWGNQNSTLYNGTSLGDNFHYSYYATSTATTLTNGGSGKVIAESTLNQYLNSKILNSENSWQPSITLDNYIDNHSWNVGAVYYSSSNVIGDKGIQKEKEEEELLKWEGKIGLLNITEYAEASTNVLCDAYTNFGYNPIYYYKDDGASSASVHVPPEGWPCGDSWIIYGKEYTQWSLSVYPNTRYNIWTVRPTGFFDLNAAYNNYSVRPAFYLKAGLSLSGTGATSSEYTINT